MNQSKLNKLLEAHKLWLQSKTLKGARLYLENTGNYNVRLLKNLNFAGADLSYAFMRGYHFENCNFTNTNLFGANLISTYFIKTNLNSTVFYRALLNSSTFIECDFNFTNFKGADCTKAQFTRCDFKDSVFHDAILGEVEFLSCDCSNIVTSFVNLPEGDLIVYKKVMGFGENIKHPYVLKLKIPAKAKRTASLIGNKCRAEYAKVLAWREVDSEKWSTKPKKFSSMHKNSFIYKTGKIVQSDSYDPNITVECTNGIHFFVDESFANYYI